jgi:hypothetical protein
MYRLIYCYYIDVGELQNPQRKGRKKEPNFQSLFELLHQFDPKTYHGRLHHHTKKETRDHYIFQIGFWLALSSKL